MMYTAHKLLIQGYSMNSVTEAVVDKPYNEVGYIVVDQVSNRVIVYIHLNCTMHVQNALAEILAWAEELI